VTGVQTCALPILQMEPPGKIEITLEMTEMERHDAEAHNKALQVLLERDNVNHWKSIYNPNNLKL